DIPLLDHGDREPLQREIVRAQAANDTATNYDDVRRRWEPFIAVDRGDRWGHGAAHNPTMACIGADLTREITQLSQRCSQRHLQYRIAKDLTLRRSRLSSLPLLLMKAMPHSTTTSGGKPRRSAGGQEDRSPALHPSVRLANSAAIHEAIRT